MYIWQRTCIQDIKKKNSYISTLYPNQIWIDARVDK